MGTTSSSTGSNRTPAPDKLRARREALGLTRAALSGLAQCSPGYIASLETGYRPRASEALTRIDAALDGLEVASRSPSANTVRSAS